MKIALCDDDEGELRQLQFLLTEYGRLRRLPLECQLFSSGARLADAVKKGVRFDLILLDILMAGLSGMDAGRELRQYDNRAVLVFLSISPNFALEAYDLRARHYLVKPCGRETLFPLLDEIIAEQAREQAEILVIKTRTGLRRIRLDKLEYCEIMNHTVCYHMANGMTYEGGGNLGELTELLLAYAGFVRLHRSYIVNLDYVAGLDGRELTAELQSAVRLPIPKARYPEIRQAFLDWSERLGGETK